MQILMRARRAGEPKKSADQIAAGPLDPKNKVRLSGKDPAMNNY